MSDEQAVEEESTGLAALMAHYGGGASHVVAATRQRRADLAALANEVLREKGSVAEI